MNFTNRSISKTSRDSETKHAIGRDYDESAFDVLVELNELDLNQVAGGASLFAACCTGKHFDAATIVL